jgi:hypothetical protein
MTRPSLVIPLLVTAAMIGAPAFAQDAVPAQAPAAAAPATPAAPGAQAPAGTPAPAADGAAPAAAPAAQVAEAPPAPPPPPPVLPTTGDGAAVTSLLTKICVPLANGGDFQKLIKSAGLKQDSKTQEWVQPLSQKPFQISIADPGTNNKGTCELTVRYAPGWDQPIIDGLNVWRFLQTPQLHLQRSDKMNSATVQRVSTTWDNYENQLVDGKMVGLILVQLNKPDGTAALTPTYDEAIVQYQIRKAQAGEGVASNTPPAPPAPAPTPAAPAPAAPPAS